MGTKWFDNSITLTALQANAESGTGETPKQSLQWLLTELRPYFAGAGDFFLFVDDQEVAHISSEDVANHQDGFVCGILIQQPVQFHFKFTDRSNGSNLVGVGWSVEENQASGAGLG